jgi:hypothetical protein
VAFKTNKLTTAEQIAIIKQLAIKEVMEELQYMIELDREAPEEGEEEYNLLDAFDDVSSQFDDNGPAQYARKFAENIRDLYIALQWFQEITEDELTRTVSTGKKYAWKHKGKKYVFVSRGE